MNCDKKGYNTLIGAKGDCISNRFLLGLLEVFHVMKTHMLLLLFAAPFTIQAVIAQSSVKPPVIPVGTDAYRLWHLWPNQRIGARAYMRSTYDRSGGNESADASHFLFMQDEDRNITLDVAGKGVLYFVRTNHWHGSPWHYTVDGKDHIIQETATADPVNAVKKFSKTTFLPAAAFPEPLAYTWSTTKGADLVWTPIGFRDSLQLAYSHTRYGTGYYIYQLYANEQYLSQPIRSWNSDQQPPADVVQLLSRAGTDIAPQHIPKKEGSIKLDKERLLLADIRASAVVRAFRLTLPLQQAEKLERMRLLVTWDDRTTPSIDAPLCLFFGAGTLYNREQHEYLVKGFPLSIRYDYPNNRVELACYYPMPFFRSARFELAGITPDDTEIGYQIRFEHSRQLPEQSSYFHATYRDIAHPELGRDLTLLDTRGIEDHETWSGNFAGTSFIFSHDGFLGTLEGDPRFFFDDSQTPQAYGTGTEEWGGGGDYWGGENMTLPFAGHPCGVRKKEEAKQEKDLIYSAYRFLLADCMPFGRRAVIRLEHGGENLSTEHYETVAYWYGLPAATLLLTDSLDIGNVADEKAHQYLSPKASPVSVIHSRYEWGIDSLPLHPWGMNPAKIPGYVPGQEIYPEQVENGRYTTGVSEFTVRLDARNRGALLRRTLDYSCPNQKAVVYVADAGKEKQHGNVTWHYAGIWYLAGANTCVYSDPKGELDKRLYKVQTSNRRFRDDEFLLPEKLTRGHAAVRVKIVFVPVQEELYPGKPFPGTQAWSELRYAVYSYVMPVL